MKRTYAANIRQPANLSGQILVEEVIGFAGGYGDVRKGTWQTEKGKLTVAVKMLRPPSDMRRAYRCKKRLRREIQVWKRLDHVNIAPLLGTTGYFGASDHDAISLTGMVSPWMENGNLITFMETRNLSIMDRLQILCDVAAGLVYLHLQNIIHGDLTCANVLINDTRKACLIDFGLSFIKLEFEGTSYFSSTVGGAIRWRAPELLPPMEGDIGAFVPNLTFACDIFSFGNIMLHVLSDELPYHNIPSNTYVLLELYRGNRPKRPAAQMLTEDCWEFIVSCWGDAPNLRPRAEVVYDSTSDLLLSALNRPVPSL